MKLPLTFCSVLALVAAAPALAAPTFNRVASFPTVANMAAGEDTARETSAEIMTATEDGSTLIYSDSPLGVIGRIDITDPLAPKPLGNIDMDGEPTTTVVAGNTAFVGVNTSESFTEPSGALRTVDLGTGTVTESCDLGGQPDAVARNADGSLLAVAIENERDEDVNDGALPQMPAGFVVTVPVRDGRADCAGLTRIDLTGLAEIGAEDPEPEYLAFNDAGEIVVTLQENNHIVVIGADGKVASHFSAGAVDLTGIDTEDDGRFDFTGEQKGRLREPDAVAWIDGDHFVTANEGDWNGGARGFTVWNRDGTVVYEDGGRFEQTIVATGPYPDGRSDNKGVEPEAVIVSDWNGTPLMFVASERASIVGVYDMTDPAEPKQLQLLPSGIGPEGLVAIPRRGLFATANETDLGEDGAARAHVMLFQAGDAPAAWPTITSEGASDGDGDGDGPLGWGALSGLTVDPANPARLFAVSDSAFDAMPSIYSIDAGQTLARITARMTVTRDGKPAGKLDLEGIAADGEGGFWLASEGDAEKEVPHAVLHVDGTGAITQEFPLPDALAADATRFGFEGVALVDGKLWLAVQREWKDDPEGRTKLLRLDPTTGDWAGVRYPLESGDGWVGLSEIAAHGGDLYLLERDNLIGDLAALKQITRVSLADIEPAALGGDLPVVEKKVVRDLIPDLKAAGGYVVDKVEGMAIAPDGTVHVVTDNDGTDDSSGETLYWTFKLP